MFGRNEIVGRKMFKDTNDLLVTTIFFTLQGEGPFAGSPAVFLRMAKCNLNCHFCDTYFDKGDWFLPEQLELAITNKVPGQYIDNEQAGYTCGIVITGGEPFLQAKALRPVVERLCDEFDWIQFETNGILPIPEDWDDLDYSNVHIVCSPKVHEKTGNYIEPHASLPSWTHLYYKFVVAADPASPYHTIPSWAIDAANTYLSGKVYISPMNEYLAEPMAARQAAVSGSDLSLEARSVVNEVVSFWEEGLLDRAKNQANHEYAARYCLENNLRLSLQQHLYVSAA